jgi:UDP-N-acetylmuramoyl-tripeptide--D-alanyl-D-alanine ligase
MRYQWADVPALLRTPLGRSQFLFGVWHRSWPLLSRLATLHRRTLIRNTRVIAVVGSFGKSTTVRAVLTALSGKIHPDFELNAFSSVARAVLRIRPRDRHAVIEAGIDQPGQMAAYAQVIRPDITVVTSIGSEHNRSLLTLEATRTEKSEMVRILPALGLAVLNGDDPNVLWMKGRTCARVITFGFNETNDIRASNVTLDWPNGTRFKLYVGGESREVRIRLIGKYMVYPILAAVAVSLAEGFSLDQVIPALEGMPPTSGRLEPIRLENGVLVLRDETKSPLETIEAALDVLSATTAQRRVVVLGEVEQPPGSKGAIYRRIGERIAKIASCAILVGDHSYSGYTSGLKRGGMPQEKILYAGQNASNAARLLSEELKAGDVVLIKGRGTQRLDRVVLSLMGRTVRCDISFCKAEVRCEHCPMLERGWDGVRVVI